MVLNSFITADGLEMGRAQAVQAYAAGTEPDVRMNPILLKPSSDVGSQLIVNGEVRGAYAARDYFKMKKSLIPDIMAAYRSLAAENDIIVIEGAGSPAEINLKADDIVNMGLAKLVDAPVLLVGDIDRGGVFAQLYGTVALHEPEERDRIVGTVINKFRGDVEILRPGLSMLEEKTGVPVLGVVSPLEYHPALGVRYVSAVRELGSPDLVILPGTKSTMEDLLWLRQSGLEAAVLKLAAAGTPVLGICGGYQMLGNEISDPGGVERGGSMAGLGLLPCKTVFAAEKARTRVRGTACGGSFFGAEVEGYEIHMGRTTGAAEPFCVLEDGQPEGAVSGNVFGTYLHGLFDSGELTEKLADWLLTRKGLKTDEIRVESHREYEERQFDILAAEVRGALDMEAIYRAMAEYRNING